MKNLYYAFIYATCVLILAATSCKSFALAPNSEQLFMEIYKDCSMNKDLRLSPEKPVNIVSQDASMLLESVSDDSVIFPKDYNIQILQFDSGENKWIKKENHIQYLPVNGKEIFGRHNPGVEYDYGFISINPTINEKTTLRVALYGHIYKDGVEIEECSGAFTDIVVSP